MTRAGPLGALLATVLCAGLTGCASPGGGASTNNDLNRCAAVLPLAREVVHGTGALILVRPINREQVDTITRETGGTPPHPAGPHPAGPQPGSGENPSGKGPKTCLVVYQGSYDTTAIPRAQPVGAHGRYALIVLWVRHPAVDRVLISDTLPPGTRRPWWHF